VRQSRYLIGVKREGREKEKKKKYIYLLFRINNKYLSKLNTMLCPSNKFALQLNKYFIEKVVPRKNAIYKAVRDVSKVVTEVLREVEIQEPRFISSLNDNNGRFDGLTVVSQTEFEVNYFLIIFNAKQKKNLLLGCSLFKSNGCI
jgi:AAA+ ATPase superfamily predicted ATPase